MSLTYYDLWTNFNVLQCGPDKVPDSNTATSQDRRLRDYDAGRGEARCYVLRCRWVQRTNREAAGSCGNTFTLSTFVSFQSKYALTVVQPERFVNLGIDPPKGILLFGPPGTGKTLCARAVANRTDATFIRVIGSELVQKYVGEGARMVRELFEMARSKKACIIFFDEVDAIGGARFDDGAGGDNEVQRTMLELINQLDGFDPRGNIKVLMATNRWVVR